MAYSTQTDILKRISDAELSQLTSEIEGVIDSAVVSEMIAAADGEIDGYIAVRYAVPLASPPKFINGISVSIAVYRLFERRASRLGGINDAVKTAYENAVKTLDAIAKGKLTLGVDPPPSASTSGKKTDIAGDARVFTKDTMQGL